MPGRGRSGYKTSIRSHAFPREKERSSRSADNERLYASRLLKHRFIEKFLDNLIQRSLDYLPVENIRINSTETQYAKNIKCIFNLTLFH